MIPSTRLTHEQSGALLPADGSVGAGAIDDVRTGGSLVYWGLLLWLFGIAIYTVGIILSIIRLAFWLDDPLRTWVAYVLWYSGIPTTIGLLLVLIDILVILPYRRRTERREDLASIDNPSVTVVLTAYNDELSIAEAVRDFAEQPSVRRVIVVSNNSADDTEARARAAGAIVVNETKRGYGQCVYRCLAEAIAYDDTPYVALAEGDGTFRGRDLAKLIAFQSHADIVNGTRIVEQLRAYRTQLTTFMYYGNFFVGKLLELKHLGKGTFTDVGTTYKLMSRAAIARLLPHLDPKVNLEFNAHFLDTALARGLLLVECPITFHPRVGESKGGNVSNTRALRVGLRMFLGLSFGWRHVRS
jgi:GT2 family glycosyltransferase